MDFFFYTFERAVCFGVASVPLILVFLQLKIFKLPLKSIAICILLNLLVSSFFWLELKDIHVALYQFIPYVLSFVWILVENVLKKELKKRKSEKDLLDLNNRK